MRWLIVFVVGLVCGGCQIGAIAPLYSRHDKVRDDRFEGVWIRQPDSPKEEGTQFTTVRSLSNGSYLLRFTAEEKGDHQAEAPLDLQGTLIKLGDSLYLDVEAPPETLAKALGDYGLFVLPIHYYYRIELDESRLSAATMNPQWLDDLLKRDPQAASCIRPGLGEAVSKDGEPLPGTPSIEPPFVLTGSTGSVQQFIAGKAIESAAWEHTDTYLKYQSFLPEADGEQ